MKEIENIICVLIKILTTLKIKKTISTNEFNNFLTTIKNIIAKNFWSNQINIVIELIESILKIGFDKLNVHELKFTNINCNLFIQKLTESINYIQYEDLYNYYLVLLDKIMNLYDNKSHMFGILLNQISNTSENLKRAQTVDYDSMVNNIHKYLSFLIVIKAKWENELNLDKLTLKLLEDQTIQLYDEFPIYCILIWKTLVKVYNI